MTDPVPQVPEEHRIYIPMDGRTERGLSRLEGAAALHEALHNVPPQDRTAGFRLALAIADAAIAELRIEHAQNALRAAARAGVNMADKNLYSGMKEGKLVLFAAPLDLVEKEKG